MAVYKYNHLGSKYLDGKSPFNVIYGFEPDYLSAWINIKNFEEGDDSYNRESYNVPDQVNNWMKLHSNLLTETVKSHFNLNLADLDNLEEHVEKLKIGDLCLVKFLNGKNVCNKFVKKNGA
jgi:hypothetical protein